jgi:hypothetical protein
LGDDSLNGGDRSRVLPEPLFLLVDGGNPINDLLQIVFPNLDSRWLSVSSRLDLAIGKGF